MAKTSVTRADKPLPAGESAPRPVAVPPLDQPARTEPVPRETQAGKPSAPFTPAKAIPKLQTPLAAVWPAAKPADPIRPEPPATVIAPTPKPPTPTRTVNVSFTLLEPAARQVSVCGDFNGWVTEATPMTRQNGGPWEASVALVPGRYQYKFLADGQWLPDLRAGENVYNAHGTLNSVLEVRA